MPAVASEKSVLYRFSAEVTEGDGSMRAELGGKGAGLAEMTRLGVPVPPGFTIPTEICRSYLRDKKLPDDFEQILDQAVTWLGAVRRQTFGGQDSPLLVSVRSGAAVSMPGMMDTILNVGLTCDSVNGLAAASGSLRFSLDSYRRLIQMFASVVMEVPKAVFDEILEATKKECGVALDSDLNEAALYNLIAGYKDVVELRAGRPFPDNAREQLLMAIQAVFRSWMNKRARHYRRMCAISDASGTAVTVQAMVFGNSGSDSGTGVGFTRNPILGEKAIFGEFLPNAQGEDIVAGARTPLALSEMSRRMPATYSQLGSVTGELEKHFREVQDFEFTVQNGELFLLQSRGAKLSALARLRSAVEMAQEGLISKEEALERVDPKLIGEIVSPQLDLTSVDLAPAGMGLPASPTSAVGRIALSADRAVAIARESLDEPVILIRQETVADDIHGMEAAAGFLTARGGATSHAAVVARGMGKCCITGAAHLDVDEMAKTVRIGSTTLHEGEWLSLDGLSGQIFACKAPLRAGSAHNVFLSELMNWTESIVSVPVRANADTPEDALRACRAGARGIGLCRTEHMFFSPERLKWMQGAILTEDAGEREQALLQLLPVQQSDFESLFQAMAGLPVTIRLIDPPLHEFLPKLSEIDERLRKARIMALSQEEIRDLERLRDRSQRLQEANPMMGHRGCRLGITHPEIVVMQVKAILEAAIQVQRRCVKTEPEIMVPLIATIGEMRAVRETVDAAAAEVFLRAGTEIDYRFGVMIELPRAALCAAELASEVDFFSFGTNDLTQMTFGFSRDDSRKYLDAYIAAAILPCDPFITLDREGVGALMRVAVEAAREANPRIKIGVCGEHGGDPQSIEFFEELGVDYVSCSPTRIPAARLAAAQAALKTAGLKRRQPLSPE